MEGPGVFEVLEELEVWMFLKAGFMSGSGATPSGQKDTDRKMKLPGAWINSDYTIECINRITTACDHMSRPHK